MRITKEDIQKRTRIFEFVQKNMTSNSSDSVTLTLDLLQKNQGGEMYGM